MRLNATRLGSIASSRSFGDQLYDLAGQVPPLDLNFAGTKTLDPRVTHTRASSGTYVDSEGVIRTATTNLLLRSEEFETTWSVLGTVTANAITAPNGTVTADLITTNGTSAQPFQGVTISSGATITGSCFLKPNGINETEIVLSSNNNTTPYARATFNISTGVISVAVATANGGTSASANIQAFANGWYRCSVTVTYPAVTLAGIRINATGATGGIYIWGAQLEQSTTVGEYIPTTSTINSAPRFDHDPTTGESLGLLVEEARTNLILRSEEFDNASWSSSAGARTITPNSVAAPDGLLTADTVAADGTTAPHFVSQSLTLSAVPYAYSVFAKAGTNNFLQLRLFNAFGGMFANFDLATGVVGTVGVTSGAAPTSSIQAYPNGWYRCTMVFTPTATTSSVAAYIVGSASAASSETNSLSTALYLWGAQLEAGSFPTSYIPTVAATVTRAADVASITGANFSSWYRQDEGTVFAEFGPYGNGGGSKNPGIVQIDSGSAVNRICMFSGASISPVLVVAVSSVNQAYISAGTLTPSATSKISAAYKINDFARAFNGSSLGTDSSGSVPTVSQMLIGTGSAGVSGLNGTIRRLTYWPTRLANTTLQQITQP